MRISQHPGRNPLDEALIESGVTVGLKRREDVNQPDQEGIGYMMRTIRDGKRESSATAFLDPVRNRPNLTVVTETLVERILFEGTRAVGVACRKKGRRVEYRAVSEVILSAGAVQSPQLLQLSGIGPVNTLKALGIDVLVESPGVGQNLRDHWAAMIQYRVDGRYSDNREYSGLRLIRNALQYLMFKRGVMAESPHEVTAYVRSRPELDRPDVQLFAGPFSLTRADEAGKFDFDKLDGMQVCAYQMRPETQGSIEIESTDAAVQPVIRPRYLGTDLDQSTAVSMVRYVRELFRQPALQQYVSDETLPGSEAQSDADILDSVRRTGTCLYHAIGTCKMGTDPLSVVDSNLKVRGVSGLRVVDGSVMPTLVSGFTNGPVMAMAWRAAELIQS
ncbi:GMC family oxidoreductase [Novosphingobium pentaromativorans]|uniref:Glucose-methanol-choline oxidoreductase n=1 Tax=Novosphingobium pentaromativorans US6-1 TaxID=1088721 RepID=G6EGK3_9SPHN|nr:GMC oxidoreductase [Novosphingobium pentaromativorans]EHJ59550.1 glucose-methanol-choline oxidoreductase [Novosphingobium pentaromativorans US6-1]